MRRRGEIRVGAAIALLFGVLAATSAPAAGAAPGATPITPASRATVVLRLEPRATAAAAPPSARQQADRLQRAHRFAEAEAVLDRWLERHPQDAAALLERARLRVAQGRARAALADCARAAAGLDALPAAGCQAEAMGALGVVAPARAMLDAALTRAGTAAPAAQRSWAQGIAAELAMRDGDAAAAESWHRAALATAGTAHYPRIAYAEFLLSRGRVREVLTLLADAPDDASVMRLRRRALESRS